MPPLSYIKFQYRKLCFVEAIIQFRDLEIPLGQFTRADVRYDQLSPSRYVWPETQEK